MGSKDGGQFAKKKQRRESIIKEQMMKSIRDQQRRDSIKK